MSITPTTPPAGTTIPAFNPSGLLPPFTGTTAAARGMSPYRTELAELVTRFATTKERIEILEGFLLYRRALLNLGITGFQWVAGSFTELIEAIEGRAPRDVDVVTFIRRPSTIRNPADLAQFAAAVGPLLAAANTKPAFKCDAYGVDLDSGFAPSLVDQTRYWFGLFTHRRVHHTWKGILEVPLLTVGADQPAATLLATIKAATP